MTRYQVVVNHEEQYSIWPEHEPPPAGWRGDGTTGTKAECLEHIGTVWTDMRPHSLRSGPTADRSVPFLGAP
ncbi:MbtH family protein [Amycolatopsis sp. NPDC088138]|uniref:MbtH family protein n=1 Tax=Amycolatopsis sp. NPDC088138 TaxID=3363938 RepID=UPI00382F9331